MNITQHPLPPEQYLPTKTDKIQVVLHHTAGGSNPVQVVDTWAADPSRIATPYVIGGMSTKGDAQYDGVVVKAFDPECDAFHLGEVHGGPANITRSTFGIEICNWGYLTESNGQYITYTGRAVPADQVVDLGFAWRGYQYWHAYTDAQIATLHDLLIALIQKRFKWDYTAKTWDVSSFEFDPAKFSADRIGTHVNYRQDKTDCSCQPKLIAMLNGLNAELAG